MKFGSFWQFLGCKFDREIVEKVVREEEREKLRARSESTRQVGFQSLGWTAGVS